MSQDWIKSMLENAEIEHEIETKGFPTDAEEKIFFLVKVGNDRYPCNGEDIEEVQKALNTAAFAYQDMMNMKFIVVPHTIDMEEMTVQVKVKK
jgi:hypothetical protein